MAPDRSAEAESASDHGGGARLGDSARSCRDIVETDREGCRAAGLMAGDAEGVDQRGIECTDRGELSGAGRIAAGDEETWVEGGGGGIAVGIQQENRKRRRGISAQRLSGYGEILKQNES